MGNKPRAILIAGPTASGKSGLAIELALRTGGAILNADSMQIYGGLRIITARPSQGDLLRAPHHLYGYVVPGQAYSVAAWLADAGDLLSRLREQGQTVIVVGGTGLYFNALELGLSPIPTPIASIREHWRSVAARDPSRLHGELAARDRDAASRLAPGDTQRLVRALEIHDSTGVSLLEWQRKGRSGALLGGYEVERFVLEPPRTELHARIARRLEGMVQEGAMEEAQAFMRLQLDPALPVSKAIGLREFMACLAGESSLAHALDLAAAATRQYAKRQSTWFRGQFGEEWRRCRSLADVLAARKN